MRTNNIAILDGVEDGWETVVDFTNGGKRRGVPAAEVIKLLEKIKNERRKKTNRHQNF